jgi:FdhD protein
MTAMRGRQALYEQTGGTHAAAVFGPDVAIAEDLGRHNALDKVIGRCLLQRQDLASCGVLLTSRLSFEMIVKAARAKFQLVCAVSAPTSLAIEIANRCGITLCGFVRENRATIFTHPNRVEFSY